MSKLTILPARLSGVRLVTPFFARDERGYFAKSFERDVFAAAGIGHTIHESFESGSKKGVVRGMHFQSQKPQAKLVSCPQGRIFDVVVDLRASSPTFGQWEGFFLDNIARQSLYIPAGFAHGFLVVSRFARVLYQCHGAFSPESDTGIAWNDSDIGIAWPLPTGELPQLSLRDKALPTLQECICKHMLPEEVLK